jgi:hypothetical protein
MSSYLNKINRTHRDNDCLTEKGSSILELLKNEVKFYLKNL